MKPLYGQPDADGAWHFQPIGHVRSPFHDRIVAPRQPRLALEVPGTIELERDARMELALTGLDGFSHLWVLWVFHAHGAQEWRPSVRPPRLGGVRKMGVLATRSPHRPNPIGMSVVRLERIEPQSRERGVCLHIKGVDMLDGTPVLDVKPYLPYTDVVTEATSGWADEAIERMAVTWTETARTQLEELTANREECDAAWCRALTATLSLDPRPAFQQREHSVRNEASEGMAFGFRFGHLDVRYEIRHGGFAVIAVTAFDREAIRARSNRG